MINPTLVLLRQVQ